MPKLKILVILGALVGAGFVIVPAVGAQVPPVVSYAAGWNMVAGPQGTDFSGAAALDAYGPNGYYTPAVATANLCQGYWAEYLSPHQVAISIDTVTTVTCPLQAGWNLVGNPFSSPATLPAGTSALYWNTSTGAYVNVSTIPIGASVWIYTATASSIVLQNSSQPTAPPVTSPTITIFSTYGSGPYVLHVGNTIELQLNLSTPVRATANPQYLHLLGAGTVGELTCVSGPTCEYNANNFYWLWQAVAPGTTAIDVAPECRYAGTPCDVPDQLIPVTILP